MSTENRFDILEAKVDALDEKFERRFEAVNRRFDAVDQRFEGVDRRFDAVDQRFDAVDQRFEGVDRRFDAMNLKIDVLHEDTLQHIRFLAEMIGATNERMDRGFDELRQEIRKTNEHLAFFIATQSAANDQFRAMFANHEIRLNGIEQRNAGT